MCPERSHPPEDIPTYIRYNNLQGQYIGSGDPSYHDHEELIEINYFSNGSFSTPEYLNIYWGCWIVPHWDNNNPLYSQDVHPQAS